MRVVGPEDVGRLLGDAALIERLRAAFRAGGETPPRQHFRLPVPGGRDAALLIMPAWSIGAYLGVKVVSVFPDNPALGKPSVVGAYLLLSARTGEPLAALDAPMLTARRTACASALAASYLAREDAARMLMVGPGTLAPHLIRAHASVRPIRDVLIWGRDRGKAARLARTLDGAPFSARVADDLEAAVRGADVISCATMATEPVVLGEWLRPGAHLDLVGGYTPAMRETDDTAMRRAEVYVDTYDGGLGEAGDILRALKSGALVRERIRGELAELVQGRVPGRTAPDQITLFKSVGAGLEDLAAATQVWESLGAAGAA